MLFPTSIVSLPSPILLVPPLLRRPVPVVIKDHLILGMILPELAFNLDLHLAGLDDLIHVLFYKKKGLV